MSKGLIITLIAIGAVLLLCMGSCSSYIGFRQQCVAYENNIGAQDKEMQNVNSEVTKSLTTQGLSANEYGKLVVGAIKAANTGRYGADGSKAMMQWIKEQNPTIDASVFKRIMVAAEAGYAKFSAAQRRKIDLAREYKNLVEQKQQVPLVGAIWTAGFPRKPWTELERIIVTEDTAEAWKTGIAKPVDPFGKQ